MLDMWAQEHSERVGESQTEGNINECICPFLYDIRTISAEGEAIQIRCLAHQLGNAQPSTGFIIYAQVASF